MAAGIPIFNTFSDSSLMRFPFVTLVHGNLIHPAFFAKYLLTILMCDALRCYET